MNKSDAELKEFINDHNLSYKFEDGYHDDIFSLLFRIIELDKENIINDFIEIVDIRTYGNAKVHALYDCIRNNFLLKAKYIFMFKKLVKLDNDIEFDNALEGYYVHNRKGKMCFIKTESIRDEINNLLMKLANEYIEEISKR